MERSGGTVESRHPLFPTLSLFLAQPNDFTDLFVYLIDLLRLSEMLQCLHFWLLVLSVLLG